MNKKIFLCGFHQETASFNPNPSTIEDYTGYIYQATGEELIAVNRGKNTLLGGMIDVAEESGYTVCGSANMCAHSGGPVQHEVVDIYLKQVLSDLKAALPVDAVLVFLHGATQSDVSDDVCGDVLTAIREVVGEDTVVSAGCDLHANVTERMMRAADYITGYQTYPHLDMCNTGKRAAMLAIRKLQGKPTYMAWTTVPQTAPAHGYTTTAGGLKTLMEKGFAMVERGEIIDFSIYQVQPWLDSCVSGSAVVVAAETEERPRPWLPNLPQKSSLCVKSCRVPSCGPWPRRCRPPWTTPWISPWCWWTLPTPPAPVPPVTAPPCWSTCCPTVTPCVPPWRSATPLPWRRPTLWAWAARPTLCWAALCLPPSAALWR